jgi:uncharacterized membrane protein YoaK (UPF0700 family)
MRGTKNGTAKAASLVSTAVTLPRSTVRTSIGSYGHTGLGVLLVAVAGYVDAIGYIALGGFFASFMSGASISLGIGISEGHWSAIQEAALVIAAFLGSAIVATVTAGVMGSWALPTVLLLEGGLLAGAVVLAGSGWPLSVSILPVVAAMGVQSTALRPVDGVRLGATFMTGTLVSLGQGLGRAVLGRSRPRDWFPHALLWCAFVAGAAAGASLYAVFGFVAVSGPAALVAGMAVLVAVSVFFSRRSHGPDGSTAPRRRTMPRSKTSHTG